MRKSYFSLVYTCAMVISREQRFIVRHILWRLVLCNGLVLDSECRVCREEFGMCFATALIVIPLSPGENLVYCLHLNDRIRFVICPIQICLENSATNSFDLRIRKIITNSKPTQEQRIYLLTIIKILTIKITIRTSSFQHKQKYPFTIQTNKNLHATRSIASKFRYTNYLIINQLQSKWFSNLRVESVTVLSYLC